MTEGELLDRIRRAKADELERLIPPGGPPGWRPFLEEILNMVEALERRLDELEKAVKDLDRKLREQRQELERLINHRTLVKPS